MLNFKFESKSKKLQKIHLSKISNQKKQHLNYHNENEVIQSVFCVFWPTPWLAQCLKMLFGFMNFSHVLSIRHLTLYRIFPPWVMLVWIIRYKYVSEWQGPSPSVLLHCWHFHNSSTNVFEWNLSIFSLLLHPLMKKKLDNLEHIFLSLCHTQ